jgi:hypothetical protein
MVLAKAWDKDALVAELKAKGLADAEKLAKDVVGCIMEWTSASAAMGAQQQPLLALVPAVIAAIKPVVDAELDKISPAV